MVQILLGISERVDARDLCSNAKTDEATIRCSSPSYFAELKLSGIELAAWTDLDETEKKYVKGLFDERIFPVLTPLAVDPSHPFPYISVCL